MKKYVLIFPPVWTAFEPHIALPILNAQLKANNFDSSVLDLNIDFFRYICNKDYLNNSLKTAYSQYEEIKNTPNYNNNKLLKYKYDFLNKFYSKNIEDYNEIPNVIEKAIEALNSKKDFYSQKDLLRAINILKAATKIALLPYIPFNFEKSPLLTKNYKDIKKLVDDNQQNIFIDYFNKRINTILAQKPDFVGISIGADFQLIAGLTLAKLLKQNSNIHVNIGGNFLSRIKDTFNRLPNFFDTFADSISYGEGELSIIELAKYIDNKIAIEEVPNLIYKSGDKIITNKESRSPKFSETQNPDYTDLDLSLYFGPEIILPLQIQKGCHWNKCTFCDMSYIQAFEIKNINNLIEEIKYNKEHYGVTHYQVIDEAIAPAIMRKFASALIENKLDIKFYCFLRLEKEFDKELMQLAHKAGLRMARWGVETGNARIHQLINKGVDFENRSNILKYANQAGIANEIYTLINIPTETYAEAIDTIDFISKNKDVIQTSVRFSFELGNHSVIHNNPQKFGLKIAEEQHDFSAHIKFIKTEGTSPEEIIKIKKEYDNIKDKYFKNFLNSPIGESCRFLYFAHNNFEDIIRNNIQV